VRSLIIIETLAPLVLYSFKVIYKSFKINSRYIREIQLTLFKKLFWWSLKYFILLAKKIEINLFLDRECSDSPPR